VAETDLVKERYERRRAGSQSLWEGLAPAVLLPLQEKERALARWVTECAIGPLGDTTLLDVGCGNGDDLLQLIRFGFEPANLTGIELLDDRARAARIRLPEGVSVIAGDAASAALPDGGFDVVMQSTVFTSILDDAFQRALAAEMWRLVAPGGGVLWIDFTYDNPRNADVRGVKLDRLRALFPSPPARVWRVGLAPPIARAVTRVHPSLYGAVNILPFLRTHVVVWIPKPPARAAPR
jgi:SAM-dependent methyltransferase